MICVYCGDVVPGVRVCCTSCQEYERKYNKEFRCSFCGASNRDVEYFSPDRKLTFVAEGHGAYKCRICGTVTPRPEEDLKINCHNSMSYAEWRKKYRGTKWE